MAASHSPQIGDGLLAESLETSIPMFGESPLLNQDDQLSASHFPLLLHRSQLQCCYLLMEMCETDDWSAMLISLANKRILRLQSENRF